MTKTQAQRQIHGMRLVATKPIIAAAIKSARAGEPTRWSVLRNRTPEAYAALSAALEDSR